MAQNEENKRISDFNNKLVDRDHRKSIAEQAQRILEGKERWGPTWQSLPSKARFAKDIAEPKGTDHVLLPKIKRTEASKGKTIRVL